MRRLALLAAALAFFAGPAAACLVCIALPERTLADRVLGAEDVVLARPDPYQPFAFAPVATLKGGAAEAPIPGLVDSQTRRRLAADPGAGVLFARDADGWTRLADTTPELLATVTAILDAAEEWDAETDHAARFAFFAARHDHEDPTIRALALAEISRSPYSRIRSLTPRLGRAALARVMRDPKMVEWAPIHILFLGLSSDRADRAFVRRGFDMASATKGGYLAAWATALAEIDGPPAVDRLRALYFEAPGRDPEEMRAVALALATLAEGGDPALRAGIDAAFRDLAMHRPALAGQAASYLTWAEDWSQADSLQALLAAGTVSDPAAEFAITNYIEAAHQALGPMLQ